MTRRKRHLIYVCRVPRTHNMTARIWIRFYRLDDSFDLIENFAFWALPASPLLAINWPKVTIFISPFVPNTNAIFFKVTNIRIASQKPDKLMDYGFLMQFFGRDHGKPFGQIKSHLIAKDPARASARPVHTVNAIFHDVAE